MLIGVLGQKGHGKDTVAKFAENFGYVRLAFADKLYQEVSSAFQVTVEALQDRSTKEIEQLELALKNCRDAGFVEKIRALSPEQSLQDLFEQPRSPRFLLEKWGTEYRREHDDAYWLNRVKDVIQNNPGTSYILTDVRFPNEYKFIKEQAGITFRVFKADCFPQGVSPEALYKAELPHLLESLKNEHASVTSLLDFEVDQYLVNVWGSPEVLQKQTETALRECEKLHVI